MKRLFAVIFFSVALCGSLLAGAAKNISLLNASYDPTRELYKEYDRAFIKYWKHKTGDDVHIDLSNAGSSMQARAILDGLEADVATLALAYDMDILAEKGGLIP